MASSQDIATSLPPPATSSEGAATSTVAPESQSSPPPPEASSEGVATSPLTPVSQSPPPPPVTSSEGAVTSPLAPESQSSPPPQAVSSEGAANPPLSPVSQSSPPPPPASSEGAATSPLAPGSQSSPPPPATSSEGASITPLAPVSQSSPPPPATSSEGAAITPLSSVSQSSPPPTATSSEGVATTPLAPVSQSSPPPPATSSESTAISPSAPVSQSSPPPPAASSEGAATSAFVPVSQSSPPPPETPSQVAVTSSLSPVSQSSLPPPETLSSAPKAVEVGGSGDVSKVVSESSTGSDGGGGVLGDSVVIGGSKLKGDAKGVNMGPMEAEGSVLGQVADGSFDSDAVGIEKGSLEAERTGLGQGTDGEMEKKKVGLEGDGDAKVVDLADSGEAEPAEVVSEPSKGSIASDVGGDGGTGEVKPLVEPKQVSLDSSAVGSGEKLGKEAEKLVSSEPKSKATAVDGEVRGAPETVAEDVNGDREPTEISSEVDKGTVNSVSDSNHDGNLEDVEDDGFEVTDLGESSKVTSLENSDVVTQLLMDLEEAGSVVGSSRDFQEIDGQIATDSEEDEAETDEDGGGGREVFDAEALAALLRAATGGSTDGNVTISSADGSRVFESRPAGLGSSVPSLRPGPARAARLAPPGSSDLTVTGESENNMDEEEKALHEKVDRVRVKFLRLVHRLGHSSEDTVAAQVLYRLGLAEGIKRGRQTGRAFGIENAKRKALHLEESGEHPLEFSCNILVLGKTGVGKSSIINSILGEQIAETNPFQPSTTIVTEISGVVDGVNIRFLDTPGLRPSAMDQGYNKKILLSIGKLTKKCPPDIVLYVDRLDTQTRDFNDLPLLRSIAGVLGSSIWFNAIVALTHAASAPPDGPNGTPLGYEVFVAQRSHVVQHSIRQAAGDMRLMNPVALVENHPSCRRNREGQRVLPNGTAWRPQLLLLCYSSKILSEANFLLKLQDPSPGKLFGFRMRSPPLPYLLSSLLQSRAYPKLPADEGGDGVDSDVDLDDLSDSDPEEEVDYEKLPPFKPLSRAKLAQLTKEQREMYFDEYEYRVKLLQKKQWREELKRLKEMKKRGKGGRYDAGYDEYDQDAAPASVPVPLPDMVLPPTFDCNNPTYRYRFLEPISRLLARPVLDTHGWDHDCGYDGVSLEQSLAILSRYPTSFALQITKDKKDFNVHLDSSAATKLGESSSGLAGFDIQTVGRQLAYILRSEAKFKNLKKNKTAAGVSMTFLGENVITGLKVEDQMVVKKRVCLVGSSGVVRSKGDVAYGANLEARLRSKDHPLEPEMGTLGISLMKWRRDLALGGNAQTQVSIGRKSKMTFRLGLNNKCTGQFSIRTSTSDHLQLSLVGVIPVALYIYRNIWSSEDPY